MSARRGQPEADPPRAVTRLGRGRHGLPRKVVVENQRRRLLAALVEAVAERGYVATTIAYVVEPAAISRRTFYEHFNSKEDCFLAAYDDVVDQIRQRVTAAAEAEGEWPGQLVAGLNALLQALADKPAFARLCLIESRLAGRPAVERHRALLRSLMPLLRAGRAAQPKRAQPPVLTEEVLVGAAAALLAQATESGDPSQFKALLPQLVQLLLTPYLGSQEADRLARGCR